MSAKKLLPGITADLWEDAEKLRRALPPAIRVERIANVDALVVELDRGGADCLPALKALRAACARFLAAQVFSVVKATAGMKRDSRAGAWRALAEKAGDSGL